MIDGKIEYSEAAGRIFACQTRARTFIAAAGQFQRQRLDARVVTDDDDRSDLIIDAADGFQQACRAREVKFVGALDRDIALEGL